MGISVNKYGSIGTTALEAATNGLAAMPQVDGKTLDQTLKLFGGFDRNIFEQVTTLTTQTQPSIQQAADYPRPAQLLKEYTEYDSKGIYRELVKNLNDPRFNVSDGLARFSRNGIGNVLNTLEQKGIIVNGGTLDNTNATQQKVNVGPEPLMYIYPFRYMQPTAKGLPVPDDGKTAAMMEPIPDDGKTAVPIPDDGKTAVPVPEDGKTAGRMTPVPDDGKTLRSGEIQQKVIIDDGKKNAVGDLNNVLNGQIPAETRNAFVEDLLLKLQKMQETTMQQSRLYQDLSSPKQ